jgi:hypothetical protein
VPVNTKNPVPIIAPMPSVIRFNGPSVFLNSLLDASSNRRSIDFVLFDINGSEEEISFLICKTNISFFNICNSVFLII